MLAMQQNSDKGQNTNRFASRRQFVRNALSSASACAVGALLSPLAGCLNKSVSALKNFKADEIQELTAVDAVSYIHDGSITAERYASELLKRYRESRVLNAITWIDEGRVMESARAVDVLRSKGQQLGPLAGLPIVVKDNINTVGFPTTAGTPALKDFYPRANAAVVDVLLSRGAVLLGKTNMHEMAMGVTTSNLAFGEKSI
jgi:indoleacetamide hydrolase